MRLVTDYTNKSDDSKILELTEEEFGTVMMALKKLTSIEAGEYVDLAYGFYDNFHNFKFLNPFSFNGFRRKFNSLKSKVN